MITHPQSQQKEAGGEAEAGILPPQPLQVCGHVYPTVNHAEVQFRPLVVGDGETEEVVDLKAGDGDSGSGGEARDDWEGDELYEEAEMKNFTQEDDAAREEGEEDGVLVTSLGVDARHQGHDGRSADGDVLET